MSIDKPYYQHIMRHSARIPLLYAKSKYIRATMPAVPPAKDDWTGSVGNGPPRSLLCLGESTMAGVGVLSLLNGLPGLIARELAETNKQKWSWRTHAHVGYSIKQLYQALETTPLNYVANLTLIAIGGNDTFYLTKISTWLHYLEKLCDLILRTNPTSKIVFASLPPAGTFPSFGKHMRAFVGGQNDLLTSTLDEYCSNQSDDISFVQEPVVFEEYAQRAGGETTLDDLFCDGYHPSAITYRLWAEDICQHIKRLYKQL